MFFKKDKVVSITTKVTKTSSQALFENQVRDTAFEQNKICPECGYKDSSKIPRIGFRRGDGKSGYWGDCKKCGAKWETLYKV